jgi:hypothetical protein
VYSREYEGKTLQFEPSGGLVNSALILQDATGFERRDGVWIETETGAAFDPASSSFGGGPVRPLLGFDTFWYTWSLANPDTRLLR